MNYETTIKDYLLREGEENDKGQLTVRFKEPVKASCQIAYRETLIAGIAGASGASRFIVTVVRGPKDQYQTFVDGGDTLSVFGAPAPNGESVAESELEDPPPPPEDPKETPPEDMTVVELRQALVDKQIQFPPKAKKPTLVKLLKKEIEL